ncbi:hypothetical protein SFRURICE_011856 [Spodoptera frugiperda]|nr:hypothetical protein SFRURICE_011856 [Spodoptera frugiperda]
MEGYSMIQDDVKSKILKARSLVKKNPKDRLNVSYIETRLENLEQHWHMFYNIHAKIIGEVKRSELFNSSYHKDGVYDEVEEIYVQFKSIDVSSWDLIIVHIVTSKLDRDTRKAWELQVASDSRDDLPTFDQLNEFLVV